MPSSHPTACINRLETLYNERDRGALATLRRGLFDPLDSPELFQVVGPVIDEDLRRVEAERKVSPWLRERHTDARLIASALFGHYIQPFVAARNRPRTDVFSRYWRGMGASARLLRNAIESDGRAGAESLDQRVTALINSHVDDLPNRLRHLVHLMRSHAVPVAFRQLVSDLVQWSQDPQPVRRRWARTYWQPRPTAQEADEDASARSSMADPP